MDRQEKVERYLSTAMWWKGLRETNNEAFLPLFFDQHRYLVLKAAAEAERASSSAGRFWSGSPASRDTAGW